MPVWIIILLACLSAFVVLVVLYRRARRSALTADSLSFPLILVTRPAVMLQRLFERVAEFCGGVVEKSLRYPAHIASDVWSGVSSIAKTIMFAVCTVVNIGDIYGMMQRLPLLFGGAGAVALPGSFVIPSALLFICMTALYGAVLLECAGLLPESAHLFPKMSEKVRKWLMIACAVGFALSLIFGVLFWVFSGIYINVDPDTAGVLTIPIFGLVGILLFGSSIISLWGLVAGLGGVISSVFWLLSCLFRILAGIVSIPLSPIDVFVRYITHGRWSIYMDLLPHEPHKPLSSPFPGYRWVSPDDTRAALQPGQTHIVELPERSVALNTDNDNVQLFPVYTQDELEKKMNGNANISIVFVGEYGRKMKQPLTLALERFNAKKYVRSTAYIGSSMNHINTAIPGIEDISPTLAEWKQASLHGMNESQIVTKLFDLTFDKLVETHRFARHVPGAILFLVDPGRLVEFVDASPESLKARLPLHSLYVGTSLSPQDALNLTVNVGMGDVESLVKEHIVSVIDVSSRNSQFASRNGEATLLACEAQKIASLIKAPEDSQNNPSLPSVLEELHSTGSPYCASSYASEGVALGNVARRFTTWIPGARSAAGSHVGDYGDLVLQARSVTNRVLTDLETTAFDSEVSSDLPCFVLLSKPMERKDARSPEFDSAMELWLGSTFNFAKCISVNANGISLAGHLGSKMLVSATSIFPLTPGSFPRLKQSAKTVITPLYPLNSTTAIEPAANNGRGRAERLTDAKKPATSSKSKTRRVIVRKSNNKKAN